MIALFAECVLCLLVLMIVSVDLNIINLLYSDRHVDWCHCRVYTQTFILHAVLASMCVSVCVSAMLTAQV